MTIWSILPELWAFTKPQITIVSRGVPPYSRWLAVTERLSIMISPVVSIDMLRG